MAGWFLLLILFCTLAVPVKADIIYDPPGSPGNTAIRLSCNGCPPGTNVICYYTAFFYGSDGTVLSPETGYAILNSYNGVYQVMLISAHVHASLEESWGSYNGGPGVSQHTIENNAFPYLVGVSQYDPYSDTGYGCGSSTPNQSDFAFQITNNTATWMQLPDGDLLPPGGHTNAIFAIASGSTNGWVLDGTSPFNGSWTPDWSNGMSLGNSSAPWTNWNPYTNINGMEGAIPSAMSNGASATALATGAGGPIIWDTTNQNQILQAGFQDTVEQLQQEQNAITNALAHLPTNNIVVNMSGSNFVGGYSNVWVENMPTNFGTSTNTGSSSNVWVNNWPFNTNIFTNTLISEMTANTQAAFGILNPANSSLNAIGSALPSSPSDNAGSPLSQNITIGNQTSDTITLTVGPIDSSISPFVSSLRSLIGWVLVFVCVVYNSKLMFDVLDQATRTPQTQGPDSGTVASTFGGNAVLAFAAAAIIFGLLSAIPVVAVGLLSGELTFFGSQVSPSTWFTNNSSYVGWLNQVFPLYMCLTLVGSQVAYFIGLRSFAVIIQTAVRLTIGM